MLSKGIFVYTAFNHRFEESLNKLSEILGKDLVGIPYYIHMRYGNGTVQDVLNSNTDDFEVFINFDKIQCQPIPLLFFVKTPSKHVIYEFPMFIASKTTFLVHCRAFRVVNP